MVGNRRGYTLTELLMVVAILGMITMLGPQIFTQTTQFFILSRARLSLQQEARAAMYVVTRELRQGQSTTIRIDQASGQPYYSRISFTKQTSGTGNAVTISQSGSTLLMTQGSTRLPLSTHLAFLSFTFPKSDDMTIVSVAMTLQEQIYHGRYKALHMASERVRVMN